MVRYGFLCYSVESLFLLSSASVECCRGETAEAGLRLRGYAALLWRSGVCKEYRPLYFLPKGTDTLNPSYVCLHTNL